jgi:hypothetical protein
MGGEGGRRQGRYRVEEAEGRDLGGETVRKIKKRVEKNGRDRKSYRDET